MATMPRTSETLRSSTGVVLTDGGGRAMAIAAEALFSATAECQREMIGFTSMRFEKDGEVVREMIACKNLADVAAIHIRWMEEILRDYNAEFAKLMTICAKSTNVGAGPKG